jgi:hypothetical protein
MGDEVDDQIRPRLGAQMTCAVEGVKPGVADLGRIADIVQPRCGHEGLTVCAEHGW